MNRDLFTDYSPSNYATGGAGFKKPGTSQKAAEAVNRTLSNRQAEVMAALREIGSGTADDIAEHMGLYPTQVRPRITELMEKKEVRLTGKTKLTKFKRPADIVAPILR